MDEDDEDRFPAKRILEENAKRKLYKVDWEGFDPETGRAWSPTWEPYDFVSDVLVTEWQAKQVKRADSDYQKAHKAALRDYDIRRENASDEGYISPPEPEVNERETRRAADANPSKPQKRRKRDPQGSGVESSRARDGQAGRVPKSANRGRKTGTAGKVKRRRSDDDDESHILQSSRAGSKKSRRREGEEEDRPVLSARRSTSSSNASSSTYVKSVKPLKSLPESLVLRTESTSVSRITHGDEPSTVLDLFSSEILMQKTSPSKQNVKNGIGNGKGTIKNHSANRRLSSDNSARPSVLRHRSDEGPSASFTIGKTLPSFKKVSSGMPDKVTNFVSHQRRASAPKEREDWALLASVTNTPWNGQAVDASTSLAVVPDSQSQNDSSLSSLVSQPKDKSKSSGQRPRQAPYASHEPGSRLAQANIEKPRMPIKVPEPSVFLPHLSHTQATEDIQQFSSQAQHGDSDEESSGEAVRQQLTPAFGRSSPDLVAQDNVEDEKNHMAEPSVFEREAEAMPNISNRAGREDSDMSAQAEKTLDDLISEESVKSALASTEASDNTKPVDVQVMHSEQPSSALPANDPLADSISSVATADAVKEPVVTAEAVEEPAPPAPGAQSAPSGPRLYGTPKVEETSTDARLARQKIRSSTLIDREDNRQELNLFLESPEYYLTRIDRMLMQQESWDFELESETDDNTLSTWHIVLDMTEPSWKLEKRVQQAVTQSKGGGENELLHLCNTLQAEVAALKKTNVQQLLRIGQLESDLAYVRKQDQSKAKDLADSFKDQQRIEAENKVLHQQATIGVQQVEMIWIAKEARMRDDLAQTKSQLQHSQELLRQANLEDLLAKAGRVEELEAREKERKARDTLQKRLLQAGSAQYATFLHGINSRLTPERSVAAQSSNAVTRSPASNMGASSEDEDYVAHSAADSNASSSSGSGSSSEGSDEESAADGGEAEFENVRPTVAVINAPAASIMDVQTLEETSTLPIEAGALTGGLASISPAPVGVAVSDIFGPPVLVTEDTSGETTEVTTNTSTTGRSFLPGGNRGSQPTDSAGLRFIESEDILELDSGILESQYGFPCLWQVEQDKPCRKLFSSQNALYEHVVNWHAAGSESS